MDANKIPKDRNAVEDGSGDRIALDLYPFLRVHKDGRVERLLRSAFVPASEDPEATGVATRDVLVSDGTGVSARLFLPSVAAAATGRKLPLVLYFHGGAFCAGSAFGRTYHRYASSLAARAGALVVSVDYRLAPEHPIPAAYDDAWAALRWASSLADPWLASHADPTRTFLAGFSAGANISHHAAVRAARAGVDIEGLVLVQPYFWGTDRLSSETDRSDGKVVVPEHLDKLWPFVTAGAAGNDDPRLDPPAEEIASLACRRAQVALAAGDPFLHHGRRYAARMRDSAWGGEVTLVESEGDHGFHLYRSACGSAAALMERVVEFINRRATSAPVSAQTSQARDDKNNTSSGGAKGASSSYGFGLDQVTPSVFNKVPVSAGGTGKRVVRSCL